MISQDIYLVSVKRFLSLIKMKCMNHEQGCTEILSYYDLNEHQEKCLKCPDCSQICPDCLKYIPTYDMARHKRICTKPAEIR